MAAEQKKQNIDLLEEDDEFEEFPTEGKSVHFVGLLFMFWMMKIMKLFFVELKISCQEWWTLCNQSKVLQIQPQVYPGLTESTQDPRSLLF